MNLVLNIVFVEEIWPKLRYIFFFDTHLFSLQANTISKLKSFSQ